MQPPLTMLEIIHMNSHTKNHRSVFNVIKKLQNILPMVIPHNLTIITDVLWSTSMTAKYRTSCFGRNLLVCAFSKCIYKYINRKPTLQKTDGKHQTANPNNVPFK